MMSPPHGAGSRGVRHDELDLERRSGTVGRALAWERALAHLPPEQRGEDAAAVPGWLEELLEPDVA